MSEHNNGVAEYVARGEAMAAAEANRRSVMRTKKFDTIAVHGLYDMEAALANQGSIIEPGFMSSVYPQQTLQELIATAQRLGYQGLEFRV